MKAPPFIGLDGEGVGGRYVLLQASRCARPLWKSKGLGTLEVFRWLQELYTRHVDEDGREPVCVLYGAGYDWNHWLRDVPDDLLAELLHPDASRPTFWESWAIRWLGGRILKVQTPEGLPMTFYDVASFFESAFVPALEKYSVPVPRVVREGKARRASFRLIDRDFMTRYNTAEVLALEQLARELARRVAGAGLELESWHGPGAIAGEVLRASGARRDHWRFREDDTPRELWQAFDCAYFGGRIESTVIGTPGPVFSYDMSSAYPRAMMELPSIRQATWRRVLEPSVKDVLEAAPLSVWLISWEVGPETFLGPLPWRSPRSHRILYPLNGAGWYWRPEVLEALERHPREVQVRKGWVCEAREPSALHTAIPELYARRQAMQAEEDPAEVVLKMGLTHLSGKVAQRVGRAPWRCLPWAGYTTSWTRARLLHAVRGRERDVVALSTDEVLSRRPLPLELGRGIGEWREKRYDSATILQSGFYLLERDGKIEKRASRGVAVPKSQGEGKSEVDWSAMLEALAREHVYRFPVRVFVTHALRLAAPEKYRGRGLTFGDVERTLDPYGPRRQWLGACEDYRRDCVSSSPPRAPGARPHGWPAVMSAPSSAPLEDPDVQRERIKEEAEDSARA